MERVLLVSPQTGPQTTWRPYWHIVVARPWLAVRKQSRSCLPRAAGRHLDAYDTDRAQYWPTVRQFVYGLEPAQLPPTAADKVARPAQQEQAAGAE
jgi:hypothetical protein